MSFVLLLPLHLLLFALNVRPITAQIELCRCAADFEQFYDVNSHRDTSKITTTKSIQYPYNYNDHYIDQDGYVIVEGIRVLSDSSTACAHANSDDDDDDTDAAVVVDDDHEGRARFLMMGGHHDSEGNNIIQQRIHTSMSQRTRALGGMMMMGGGEKVGLEYVVPCLDCLFFGRVYSNI